MIIQNGTEMGPTYVWNLHLYFLLKHRYTNMHKALRDRMLKQCKTEIPQKLLLQQWILFSKDTGVPLSTAALVFYSSRSLKGDVPKHFSSLLDGYWSLEGKHNASTTAGHHCLDQGFHTFQDLKKTHKTQQGILQTHPSMVFQSSDCAYSCLMTDKTTTSYCWNHVI